MRSAHRLFAADMSPFWVRAAQVMAAAAVLVGGACAAAETPTTAPAPAFKGDFPGSDGDLPWKMLAATAVVLVLGCAALYVFKKVLPRMRMAAGKRISVIETVYLEPRKAVHLLQVGSIKLLVASSPEGLAKLDNVTEAFPPDFAEVAKRVGAIAGGEDEIGPQ